MLSHQILDAIDSRENSDLLITLTADIVSAHVSRNSVPVSDVGSLIQSVHAVLSQIDGGSVPVEKKKPAVSVRSSVKADHIVCLEDGKKFKTLKRHLKADHGLTPKQYRDKWDLPDNYPLVANNYADRRRALAREIGLGTTPRSRKPRRVKS